MNDGMNGDRRPVHPMFSRLAHRRTRAAPFCRRFLDLPCTRRVDGDHRLDAERPAFADASPFSGDSFWKPCGSRWGLSEIDVRIPRPVHMAFRLSLVVHEEITRAADKWVLREYERAARGDWQDLGLIGIGAEHSLSVAVVCK